MTTSYDLIVIGAGPGGYVAAIRAAQLGMRVACIEKEKQLGGTCLRVGCIPSKALLDSSEHYHLAQHAFAAHGIRIEKLSLDLPAMHKRKDKVVKGLTGGVASLFKKNGVERFEGSARLAGNGQVHVTSKKDTHTFNAAHILIASGSTPTELPGLPFDGQHIVSSTEALAFDAVPQRLLVIGGGAIGLELGSVWARLGSRVLVVEMMGQITPGMDTALAGKLQKALEKQGIKFLLSAKASEAKPGKRVKVQLETHDGQRLEETADKVLVAVGRRPYTQGLGLEAAGVALDDAGRIRVNERFETSAAGVFAIGDVIRGPMLAHKAQEEGIACVEFLAGQAGHVNYDAIPSVVYTWPELAAVGKTEADCKAAGIPFKLGKFSFRANGRARAAEVAEGTVKIVAHAHTDALLGAHILGPCASELVAECVSVIEFGGSAEDLARTCHAHPTFSEALKEAALDAAGRVIHA